MKLINTAFGMNTGDPHVPELEFLGAENRPRENATYCYWQSILPAEADQAVIAEPPAIRCARAIPLATTAGGINPPWAIHLTPRPTEIEMIIQVHGDLEWNLQLPLHEAHAITAQAAQKSATGWAAWHATGQTHNHEHAMGILWLTATGTPWPEATTLTQQITDI